MRYALATLVTAGALSIATVALAATPGQQSPSVSQTSVVRHATRGVVEAIDATTLVIARTGNRGQMTFELSPSIHRDTTVVVGTPVSVRYREDGTKHVATAITVLSHKKQAAVHVSSASR